MSYYWSNKGAKHKLLAHIVWCPKYRRKVLTGKVSKRLQEVLYATAEKNNWDIITLEVMPDHVHVLVQYSPEASPAHVANQFKGISSRILRTEFQSLRTRLPTLWSRSYFVSSVGINEKIIQDYIDTQYEKVRAK